MLKDDKFAFISEAAEPLLLADFKTRQVLAVSDSLTRLFASSPDRLVNAKLDSIIATPSKVVDLGSFFETVEIHGMAKLDRVVLKSDKSYARFLEIYASLLPGENKKLIRIWVHDITERETTIAAYQKNELLRNRVEELGKFGHWERDMQTGKGVWSDELYRILGLDPKEHDTSLETLFRLVAPEDLGNLKNAIEKAMSDTGDGTIDVQYRINCPDGTQKNIDGFARMFEDEHTGNRNFVGILLDMTERKQAEVALRDSEEKHAQAQALAHLGHWSWNVATNKVSWSDECYRIFGRKPGQLDTYEAFLACVHPEDRERVIANVEESISTGKPYRCEYRIVFPDGIEERQIDAQGEAILDAETGEPIRLMGTVLDITERKQAEEALQKSEEKFEKAFVSSPDSITISRLKDGSIVEVNASFEKMFGYTRQEVIGKTSLELGIVKNSKGREVFKKILQKESRIRDFELEVCRKSGEVRTCRFSAELIELQGETHLLAISRDITESKQAAEALREANERFQLAFEIANIAICLVDIDVRFTLVNGQMCKMFGYTKEELESMAVKDITHPDDWDVSANFIQRASSGEIDDAVYIKRYIHKDGHDVWGDVSISIVRDAQGNPIHSIAYILDITERKQAVEKLKASEKSLSHAQQIAHLGSWEYSFATRKASWSDEAYRIFGINPDEISPSYESYLETIHPDDRALVDKVYIDSIRDMTSCELEYRIVMKDGRIKHIRDRWENLNDDNGKPLISFGTMLDITDRVRHENEIQDRKSRLSLVKDIAMEITSEMSIEEVVTNSLNNIFKMLPDYRVSYGVRIDENLYRCMASVGPSSMKSIEGTDFDMTDAPEFVEALTKEHIVTNDILQDEIVAPLRSQLEKIQVRAMINTPVTHAVGLKGLIWLDSDLPHSWSDHEITTLADASRYMAVAVKNAQLVEEQSKTAADLREASEKLRAESQELTLKNIALNQVLIHLEKEKQNYKEQISESVESLLMPIVKKLKKRGGNLSPRDISLLENSLDSIVGKEIDVFRKNLVKLSPRELDICELIREGKSSKEISSVLNLSTLTIHKHRESIRSKLQLKNRSTSLSAYLRVRESLVYNTQSVRN
ncbi:MAG: PAS domain S-box protein [candidate division Zixibacteria bacterium]|nr:PAS domain S-box protein [candidate division Zixibacteria bacterium]